MTAAGFVAGALAFAAFIPYAATILRGETRPARASWLIWSILGIVLAAASIQSGIGSAMWVPLVYATTPILVFVLALRYGHGGFSRIDLVCLTGAAFSLAAWAVWSSPLIAIIGCLVTDVFGTVPTAMAVWREPNIEATWPWGIAVLANLVNLVAIDHWTVAAASYPIYLVANTGLIALLSTRSSPTSDMAAPV